MRRVPPTWAVVAVLATGGASTGCDPAPSGAGGALPPASSHVSASSLPEPRHARASRPPTEPATAGADCNCFQGGNGACDVGALAHDSNEGVEAVIEVRDEVPPADSGAGCLSCWVAESMDRGSRWAQLGWKTCQGSFTDFFQVYDARGFLYDSATSWVARGEHRYAMVLPAGAGTTWTFEIDGTPLGAFDLKSASGGKPGVQAWCEEGDGTGESGPFVPRTIHMHEAMRFYDQASATWAPAPRADAYNNTCNLGLAGHHQDSALRGDELVLGGATPFLAGGERLWLGGAGGDAAVADPLTPPTLVAISPTPGEPVSGTITIEADITPPPGLRLTGVSFHMGGDGWPPKRQCADAGAPASVDGGTQRWTCDVDTTAFRDGQHTVMVQAKDSRGPDSWTYYDYPVRVENADAAR